MRRFARLAVGTRSLKRPRGFLVEPLEARQMLAANPIITEFMADNQNSIQDAASPTAHSDWIEIQNAGDAAINLAGWHLTDNADDLSLWTFPSRVLAPGEFLVVFASGNDVPDTAGNLHTNFSLNAGGEYLALVRPDLSIASEFGEDGEEFPQQYADISYGIGVSETVTPLVTGASAIKYLTPTASGQLPANWNTVGGSEAGFATGLNGIGYNLEAPPPSTPGFYARVIDVSGTIDAATTAEQVAANPTPFGVQSDAAAIVGSVDFAGGGGSFAVNRPYPNGVANESMDDFIVHARADIVIPAGTWQIAFGSDDGGRLRLDGANFLSRFGENGTQSSADEIRYEAPRGHGWTGGLFTSATTLASALDAIMYERGGGDSFEIAIRNAAGGVSSTVDAANGWQLLGDGVLGWTVSTNESLPPTALYQPGGAGAIGGQTIVGGLNLSNNAAVSIELNGNTKTADKLTVTGTMTLGGSSRLEVSVLAGSLQAGDSFDIFDATATSGTFQQIALPLPAVGLTWDTSLLHTTGVIRVIVDPNPDEDPLPGNSTRQQIEEYAGLIRTDVEAAMFSGAASAFVRIPFSVTSIAAIDSLRLRMKYDDGFVAYINGQEVARTNAPAALTFDAAATAERTKAQALAFADIPLSFDVNQLNLGAGQLNALAIHGLNLDPLDNDFLLLAELSGVSVETTAQRYFRPATPGAVNNSGAQDIVVPLDVSHERGFYSAPFQLTLTTATADAVIRYTTNGSPPTETTGTVYSGPVPISSTTTLRAAAFRTGYLPTPVETNTYLFVSDVATQTAAAALASGFPATWGGTGADYGLDPDVVGPNDVFGGVYAASIRDDLLALPSLSIVMNSNDMFGSNGIYSNPDARGAAWERPTSVEYLPADGSEGFQIDAGIRVQGGAFRSHGLSLKKSFRLAFRDTYGEGKLEFPFFGEDAADEFDAIVLRANSNDAWNFWGGSNVQYLRDQWGRSTQLAMGQPSSHGKFVHLYINGQYWGLYNPSERPNQSFAATYFGGDKDNWDAINSGSPVNGDLTAWNTMISLATAVNTTNVAASDAAYQQLQGNNADGSASAARENYLDVENLIDYMIVNLYGGNSDWPHKNYWVGRERGPESTGFKFFMWDSEWSLGIQSDVNSNQVGVSNGVAQPYGLLRANAEFRLQFADRLQKHFFNGGALYVDPSNPAWDPAHPERNVPAARYAELAAEIEQAIVGESARWGDMGSATPRTYATWDAQRDSLMASYFPQRSLNVLNQFRSAGLFPNTTAPQFTVNGAPQHGGSFAVGAQLSVANPNAGGQGTVYVTFDGSDPRSYNWTTHQASVSPTAIAIVPGSPTGLVDTVTVKARVRRDIGGGVFEWSALSETTFSPVLSDLRITEVHFHPAEPTAEELAVNPGFANGDFEFVELRNVGPNPISLSGASLSNGVTFSFAGSAVTSLAAGERVVVVSNLAAFQVRYAESLSGIRIAGEFTGSLNNAGESIVLSGPFGDTLTAFEYSDEWYAHTDGEGFSLTVVADNNLLADLSQSTSWRPSQRVHGSPGSGDVGVLPGGVVINEVQANTLNADRIELYNTTAAAIDVGNWFVSNSEDDRRKYRIAAGTSIPAGGFLVLTEASHFGPASGHAGALVPFNLSEHGDTVVLTASDATGELFGYREEQTFAATLPGEAIGVHRKTNGGTDFVRLIAPTFGGTNAGPSVGPLVINEIMYHPLAGAEFVEIRNVSANAVALDDSAGNAWRLRGAIDLVFPLGQTIAAGGYALVVQGAIGGDTVAEAAAFRATHEVPAEVPIFLYNEVEHGSLNNAGEKLFLDMPGAANSGLPETPYVLVDAVRYDPVAPWPTEADGGGSSLSRIASTSYGNDVANWIAGTIGGTPGTENVGIDTTPPTTPANLAAKLVAADQVRLAWNRADDPQTAVSHYNIYRNGAHIATTPLPVMTDVGISAGTTLSYQVAAVNGDGLESARSGPVVVGAQTIHYQDGVSPTAAYSGTRDTEIRSNAATQNFGADTNLEIDGEDGGADLFALFRWQLNAADIPAGSAIVGASITLDVTNETGGPFEITQLLRDWDESQTTWSVFRTGQSWATPGGLGAADRGAVLGTMGSAPVGRQTFAFNAAGIQIVRQWLSGAVNNFGVVIGNTTTTNGVDISSREVTTAANRPRLSISYVPAATPGTPGDVDQNGAVNSADIDLLFEAIAVGSVDPAFDLNADSLVNRSDVDHLVRNVLGTNYGDANLDGVVGRGDAVTLSRHLGTAARWSTGDFDGDRKGTLADLALLQSGLASPGSPAPTAAGAVVAASRVPRMRAAVPAATRLSDSRSAPTEARESDFTLRVRRSALRSEERVVDSALGSLRLLDMNGN